MLSNSREFDSFNGHSFISPQLPVQYEWFDRLLESRHRRAQLLSSALSVVVFYVAVAFYQIEVLHPIASFLNLFYLLFSATFWFGAIFIGVLGYFLASFFISRCFHPLYEMNRNVAKYQVVMAASSIFVSYMLLWFLVVSASLNVEYSSWSAFILFTAVAFFTSYQTALSANFRWECAKGGLFSMLFNVWRLILKRGGTDLAQNVARGYMIATPLCMLIPSFRFSFFDLIFAFSTNISNFFLIFVLQAAVRFMFEIINLTVMQPILLPLIGQGSGRHDRPQPNLINAITSENDLLREFGFFALREIAQTSIGGREIIFSLSQPGKKPRNWAVIYESCSRIIEVTREMLQVSTAYVEPNLGAVNQKSNAARLGLKLRPVNAPTIRPLANRQFDLLKQQNGHASTNLLQPPQLNPRVQVSTYQPRFFRTDLSMIPGHIYIEHWIDAFCSSFLRPTPNVSSYYMKLSEYCIDTLAALSFYSVKEDSYGIVQTNLSDIVSMFLHLELTIDLYLRSSSSVKNLEVSQLHNCLVKDSAVLNSLTS
ncbi:Nucleoporin protein Ndc1-Nup [Aphelenchoides bicaudatus]|nr:Nucleoporin protein Ndc1-Nup [Aphelenchoides bicaudatus]